MAKKKVKKMARKARTIYRTRTVFRKNPVEHVNIRQLRKNRKRSLARSGALKPDSIKNSLITAFVLRFASGAIQKFVIDAALKKGKKPIPYAEPIGTLLAGYLGDKFIKIPELMPTAMAVAATQIIDQTEKVKYWFDFEFIKDKGTDSEAKEKEGYPLRTLEQTTQSIRGLHPVKSLNGYTSIRPLNGYTSIRPLNGYTSIRPLNGYTSIRPKFGYFENGGFSKDYQR